MLCDVETKARDAYRSQEFTVGEKENGNRALRSDPCGTAPQCLGKGSKGIIDTEMSNNILLRLAVCLGVVCAVLK